MVILAIVYMFNFIDRQILAILLPAIRDEFMVSDTILGLLAGTAFALFYATLGVPIALLADRWNRRNLIALALAVWSGMTALCGAATSFVQLALARIGVGVGVEVLHRVPVDVGDAEHLAAAEGAVDLLAGLQVAHADAMDRVAAARRRGRDLDGLHEVRRPVHLYDQAALEVGRRVHRAGF